MDIREAITKAGPGGKITRTSVIGFYPWVVDGDDGKITTESGGPIGCMANHFTATDWEVVPEERIEVGDTVQHILSGGYRDLCGCEHSVLSISDGSAHCEGLVKLIPINQLTLIHKGSKKYVLEGVEVDHCIPPGYFVFSGTGELAGSGIKGKLRMTLEEM